MGEAPSPNSPGAPQRVLGVDPGSLSTGWGVVCLENRTLLHLGHGAVESPVHHGQPRRLRGIYQGLSQIIRRYEPHALSVEKVFFAQNAQSALKLGQVRGVVLLAAAEHGIAVHEYAPTEIKMAVVGYGRAGKGQVQQMVTSLLRLSCQLSKDAADALAAAICHLHQHLFQARVGMAGRESREGSKRWKAS